MLKVQIKKGFSDAEKRVSDLPEEHEIEYVETPFEGVDAAALELIPEGVARDFHVFPLSRNNTSLRLAIGDPDQIAQLDKFRMISSMDVVPVLMPPDEIDRLIEQHIPWPAADEGEAREGGNLEQEIQKLLQSLEGRISPVELVNAIIAGAAGSRATDIHLDPQEEGLRVRFRIDGVLYDIIDLPRSLEPGIVSRIKVLCNMDITNTRTPQDGHFTIRLERDHDLRVATVPTYFGEKIVLRFIGSANVIKSLEELGMNPFDQRAIDRFVKRKGGMLLVTGPMGSGKTTTLYAVLNALNVLTENIVTIEDPIEFQLAGVNQVQVNVSADLTYTRVLRGALRLDIDTLMVGEIRDDESAHIAVRAAVTGHRVLSTMHTNNALETITAMRHMGIKSFMIASALNVVIAQRLVRTNCFHCKEPYEPPRELLAELGVPAAVGPFYHSLGCPKCNYTGFFGRTGIFEALKVDGHIKSKITAGAPVDEIVKEIEGKMKFILERGAQKVAAGITTVEEVLRAVGL